MKKSLANNSNCYSNFMSSSISITIDILQSYRPPFYSYLKHKKNQNKIIPQDSSDIENQINEYDSNLKTLYKNFPASNPKFYTGSFFMNLTGIIVQVAIILFLSKNTEKDSDVSGIITTLPKTLHDIPACLSVLILKDMLLNMIEIGAENRALLTDKTTDKLSLYSFAAMRIANFIRFPNYLHNNKDLSCAANITLHSTSVLCSGFFLENLVSSTLKTNSIDSLNSTQKKLAMSSNNLFSLGAVLILGTSLTNIISMKEKQFEPSLYLITALGFIRMILFLIANILGKKLYTSLDKIPPK